MRKAKYKVGDALVVVKDSGERYSELYHDDCFKLGESFKVESISEQIDIVIYWKKDENSGIYEEAVEYFSKLHNILK